MGEWLKPTDCKSVPPSEVRRFESSPVHHDLAEAKLNTRKKFAFSLLAFAVLALLCWQTMSNEPILLHDSSFGFDINIRFRTATLAVIGLLAALTTISFWRTTLEEKREASSKE